MRIRSSHRAGRAVLAAVAVGSLVVTAGCGGNSTPQTGDDAGSAASTYDKFNEMTGQARHDALVEAAEAEGSLVFYTASSGMDPVIAAFEDTYDISVDLYSGQSDTVLQRIVQEYSAGFHGVDVLDDAEAYAVAQLGYTYEYLNPELTSDIPGYDPESHVAATRLSVYTQAWNTDLINESEIPDTLDGFTDPKWKGKLSLDPRDWIWYTGVMDYYTQEKGWTEDRVDEMIRTLADYSVLNEGHTVQAQLLLAGEFPVSLSVYTQSVDRETEKAANAPITWRKADGRYIEPLVFQAQGATLMKNAQHPAAAMLFIDFLLTEGQRILAEEDRTPTAVAQTGGPLDGIPNEDLHEVDFEKFTTQRDEWVTRFDELLK
nr:extracellular solute-binding protein [Micromonospora sp. DSM 115978]